jgi:hypothetical protein
MISEIMILEFLRVIHSDFLALFFERLMALPIKQTAT